MKQSKHLKSSWKSRSTMSEKPWGREISWTGHPSIHGKILYIEAGHRTSFKYYSLKAESLYLLRGKAKITYGTEISLSDPVYAPMKTDIFIAGECLLVQSGCPYRIEAVEDCEIIEIGNHLSDNPIRLEDDYGQSD